LFICELFQYANSTFHMKLLPIILLCFTFITGYAAPVTRIYDLAQQEKSGMIHTMRDLVNIESGSKDLKGLAKIAGLIHERLEQLGGKTEFITPTEMVPMSNTPDQVGAMVRATFKGTGKSKIMLIAHMDTVYLPGMLKDQPFRLDGNRAYGLGIADDKQGIATILHTVAILQKMGFKDYDTLTVLINADEEIGSPGSRKLLTQLGAEQDVVLSYESGTGEGNDGTPKLRLATSGIAAAFLTVEGKASHSGAAPEKGVNALVEMAHQILQTQDLSQPEKGIKFNWTMAQAGSAHNVIPAHASARGDARAINMSDFDQLNAQLQERIKNHLLPDAKVNLKFEVRRPPLVPNETSRKLAAQGKAIYAELGLPIVVSDRVEGGGTDAALAALESHAAIIEGMGLTGYGAHTNSAEYVLLDSIVPRLYLSVRMIIQSSGGR
jgi:glutamate carboxypeptidase